MGDAFNGIRLAVREIIHRVNDPIVSGSVVFDVLHPINHRVAHQHVVMGHVNLGPQNTLTFLALACFHFLEQAKVFLRRSLPERAVGARSARRTFLRSDRIGGLVIDVSQAVPDQVTSVIEELLEIIAGVELSTVPFKPQPGNVFSDGVDVFDTLLFRIGIVETQVGLASVFLRKPEAYTDGLGVTDVQVAVGFRWKACMNLATVFAGGNVCFNLLLNKVQRT